MNIYYTRNVLQFMQTFLAKFSRGWPVRGSWTICQSWGPSLPCRRPSHRRSRCPDHVILWHFYSLSCISTNSPSIQSVFNLFFALLCFRAAFVVVVVVAMILILIMAGCSYVGHHNVLCVTFFYTVISRIAIWVNRFPTLMLDGWNSRRFKYYIIIIWLLYYVLFILDSLH